jgi:hypothetical protein
MPSDPESNGQQTENAGQAIADTGSSEPSPSEPAQIKDQPNVDAPSANYFVRHWRGQLSLAQSYWFNGLGLTLVLRLLQTVIGRFLEKISMGGGSIILISTSAAISVVTVWQFVGIWRSASNHTSRGGQRIWSVLAKALVLTNALGLIWATGNVIVPQAVEHVSIIAGDLKIPAFDVRVLPGGKEIEIRGGFRAGCAKTFAAILDATPNAKTLRIDSVGGRMIEATRIASMVRDRGLTTYVQAQCMSAATLVFVSGKDRVIETNAKIGFHEGDFPGITAAQRRLSNQKVFDFLCDAGISRDFASRVIATPHNDMWFPSVDAMYAARVITKDTAPFKILASNLQAISRDETDLKNFMMQEIGVPSFDDLQEFVLGYARQWRKTNQEMESALEKADNSNLYSERVMKSEAGLQNALATQTQRKKILETSQTALQDITKQSVDKLATFNPSDPITKAVLESVLKSFERERTSSDENFALQFRVEHARQQLLGFLLSHFHQYQLDGKTINFADSPSIREYRALSESIDDAQKALFQWHEKNAETLEKLKSEANKTSR